jgi:hypothetical protein
VDGRLDVSAAPTQAAPVDRQRRFLLILMVATMLAAAVALVVIIHTTR